MTRDSDVRTELTLEAILSQAQAEAALLWDAALGLTQREQELVKDAFSKGIEIGRKLAGVKL